MKELLRRGSVFCVLLFISLFVLAQKNVVDKKTSIHAQNVLARIVLTQLRGVTGALFVYEEKILSWEVRVTLHYENAKLSTIITDFCAQLNLNYHSEDNFVWFIPKGVQVRKIEDVVTVTGTVVDENNEPILGATVYAVQSKTGTSTDVDGNFKFQSKIGELLTVSYVGMNNYTVRVTKDVQHLKVRLESGEAALEEVVVTGYQNINKGRYVGAVSTVKMEDIAIAGENTIDQMLQGVVPGMSTQIQTGQVGTAAKIRVRGTSTLLGNREPLWVVDGISAIPFQCRRETIHWLMMKII